VSPSTAAGRSGPEVSGGGSIAVETDGMLQAAQRLAQTGDALAGLTARTAGCVATMTASVRRQHAEQALGLLRRASGRADAAGAGLRTAAVRYGTVEHLALDGQQGIAAVLAALTGGLMRVAVPVLGVAGPVLVATGAAELAAALVIARTLQRTAETGRFAPQSDPVLLRSLALVLASLDDGVRGALLMETPEDVVSNDPAGPFGTEHLGTLLAALLLHAAGGPLSVQPTTTRPVERPGSLVALADRLPDGHEPQGQVRIERYEDADGTPRWIVYIAGTVTFSRDSGDEPFDLASDVLGVAHRPSDSERAVLQAMGDSGIGPDDPVLLVGHSQGALNAVRVAQDGGYTVGGVVELGGPTGQIALQEAVPVLAVEHDEDLVAVLGGTAATGAAGLRRVVVRRSLPDGGFGVRTSAATAEFPAHDLGAYRRTLDAAERADDARIAVFKERIGGFLDGGPGTATRWRARRISPGPGRTGDAAAAPRPSR
jgi:hypothetical protein